MSNRVPYEIKTVYVTADGKQHKSPEAAIDYTENRLRDFIEPMKHNALGIGLKPLGIIDLFIETLLSKSNRSTLRILLNAELDFDKE